MAGDRQRGAGPRRRVRGYRALFLFAFASALLGALAILPIRSVR